MNECQAGVGLCGEEAECFNGVGTYLCRCRKGYEDHSPSKAGTLCIRTPRAGRGRSCSPAPSRGLLFSRCERRRVAAGASTRGSLLAWGPAPLLMHVLCGITAAVALGVPARCGRMCSVFEKQFPAGNTTSPGVSASLPPVCCFLCIEVTTWHM